MSLAAANLGVLAANQTNPARGPTRARKDAVVVVVVVASVRVRACVRVRLRVRVSVFV